MEFRLAKIRVLTLDGGGMRGIYTAAFLNGLADQFAKKRNVGPLDIGKGFDLIVGTSTGAIVACAAAIGLPMQTVVDLYAKNGKDIFPQKLKSGAGALTQILGRSRQLKKGAEALRDALDGVLGDKTFADVHRDRGIALAITAVEMSQQRSWIFKTGHLGGHRDDAVKLVDACMASSAAPIYRSLAAIPVDDGLGGHRVFADGGLWANNPVLVGLIDALKMGDGEIDVFSAGTFPRPEGERIGVNQLDRGFLEWKFGGAAASLSIAAQEYAFDNMARMLAGEFTRLSRTVETVRFPSGVLQPALLPYLDLDDGSPEAASALIDQARADLNVAMSACDDATSPVGKLIRDLFMSMPIAEGE